jgi:hypothetical protein
MNSFENVFRNVSECEYAHCKCARLGDTYCKRHGGVGKRCVGVVYRTGDQCNNYANDCGEKCGVHGGISKRNVDYLNRFLSTRTITIESPPIVRQYVVFLQERRRAQLRLINQNVDYIRARHMEAIADTTNAVSESLISSFAKVSISDDCAICLSELVDGVEHPCCKKASCGDCMKKWMCSSDTCPYCRAKLK